MNIMKYKSKLPANSIRSLKVSDLTSIQSMMPSYLILSEIKGKSLTHKIKVTVTYKKYKIIPSEKLNKYLKYDGYLLDRARDIKHNHWTIKI